MAYSFADMVPVGAGSSAPGFGFQAVPSNTPPNQTPSIEVGIDWIQGTLPVWSLDPCLDYLSRILGDFQLKTAADGSPVGNRFYRLCKLGPCGSSISWGYRPGYRADHCCLSLPASALALLSPEGVYDLILYLKELAFKPSRVDIRLDDYEKRITPQNARDYADKGYVFGFNVSEAGRCYSYVSGRDGGETIYFGSRGKNGSGKYVRVYDKNIESGGEINAIRVEVELSAQKVKDFWVLLVNAELSEVPGVLLGAIASSIRFAKCRDNTGRSDRADNLPVWDELVSGATPVIWSSCKKQDSLSNSIKWLRYQVSGVFAAIMEAMSRISDDASVCLKFFYELWALGEEKIAGDADKQKLIDDYVAYWGGGSDSLHNEAIDDEFVPNDDYIKAAAAMLPGKYWNPAHYSAA